MQIAKVFDQYQTFVSLEDQLFSLEQERIFVKYNAPGATEAEASGDHVCLQGLTIYQHHGHVV